MTRKLLISLGLALYVAAFIVGGCELVAHTGGTLSATIVCGPLVGLIAATVVGGVVTLVSYAVGDWWDWVRAG